MALTGTAIAATIALAVCAVPDAASAPPESSVLRPGPSLTASAPVRVSIPSIGLDAEVVAVGVGPEQAVEVPADPEVAGWYRDGPTPGEAGPAVIVGHVNWNRRPGVFGALGELRPFDEISITRRDGSIARFRVAASRTYAKAAFPTAAVYADRGYPALRLVTCAGRYDRAAHGYRDNVVVFAVRDGA